MGRPVDEHPKRPVLGFGCPRREVSGARIWGWAAERFGSPERFFEQFFVANYSPLVFMEKSARNRTPDKLPKAEREPLFAACDRALRRTVDFLNPRFVVGIGRFAEDRIGAVLGPETSRVVGRVPHPSPANPQANRGWSRLMDQSLEQIGITGS